MQVETESNASLDCPRLMETNEERSWWGIPTLLSRRSRPGPETVCLPFTSPALPDNHPTSHSVFLTGDLHSFPASWRYLQDHQHC